MITVNILRSENAVHKDIIRSFVKRNTIKEMYTQPSKIITRELLLKSGHNSNHGDINLLRNSTYTTRKKHQNLSNTVNDAVGIIAERISIKIQRCTIIYVFQ